MSVANPILRDDRAQSIASGDGQTVFGPLNFKIYDPLDLRVFTAASGLDVEITSGFSISAQPAAGEPYFPTVTFDVGRTLDEPLTFEGLRIHERQLDVTQGGVVNAASIERELDRMAVVLQELRRDADRIRFSAGVNANLVTYDDTTTQLGTTTVQAAIAAIKALTPAPGWSPVPAIEADGTRRVIKVIDWAGGSVNKPAVNKYLGASGFVDTAGEAVDIRGATGPAGAGSGDMLGANNLSDLADATASRGSLGLGNSATKNVGAGANDVAAGNHTHAVKAPVALVDEATPALDASAGEVFDLVATGNREIAVPTSPSSGQKIVIRHHASGAARTLSLNTGAGGFRFGTDIAALSETESGKTDHIGAIYDATDSKWDVVAYAKGY